MARNPDTYLKLCKGVLQIAERPLSYREIWEKAVNEGITGEVGAGSKTPWQSLSTALFLDIRNNSNTEFGFEGRNPRRYFLKIREEEFKNLRKQSQVAKREEEREERTKANFHERDLHPLLAYFVHSNLTFLGDRDVYTKTIMHEKSAHASLKEWLHPDMVGVYMPFEEMGEKVIGLNREVGQGSVFRVFSFELKKKLTKKTYRENFFQAVSNSSWAHEGYLVTAEISEDDELHLELERLTNAFGIGIIYLNLANIDDSEIMFPAKPKSFLDWETINKLYDLNEDFTEFIDSVYADLKANRIGSWYDEILTDPEKYIRTKLKIELAD